MQLSSVDQSPASLNPLPRSRFRAGCNASLKMSLLRDKKNLQVTIFEYGAVLMSTVSVVRNLSVSTYLVS
ncbi:hypothetical protein HBI24_023190 [Parastagonospora nodorum]|nr:hypothetical protein HBH53_024710 [Parastagonospora nodorum]KAH4179000.1 hypothetical protein HBH43_031520 [Parastagonospora nodorum]KAH4240194.1 hypothetical protein HBI06_032980 [Parastagonospora nodorum]KAH4244926.1 hypothetical protein HBI05_077420 [Parastagonospora nodorum]KAH4298535.1 hypothetical protein HBI01_132850 [Parastagonospora nodorum]